MKIRLMLTALLGLATVSAFAQKGELSNAQKLYDNYTVERGQAVMATQAKNDITGAKASIDKASANPKTAELPQTYAVKAAVYAALLTIDTTQTAVAANLGVAQDALKKATDLDTKKENTKIINDATLNIAQYHLNKGVAAYQGKKFDEAYKSFDAYRQLRPADDTTALLYTALAAGNSNNYSAAIANYSKLVTTNYSKKVEVYNDLSNMQLANKDTAGALKTIDEALTKYPSNADIRRRQIIISLQTGKQNDVITKLDDAIKKDPKNKDLYLYEGMAYSQMAESANASITKIKGAAAKSPKPKPGAKPAPADPQLAGLEKTRNDNFAKASDMYKKALEIDPNYFEANLNMGYVTISPALAEYNDIQMTVTDQKVYDARMAKVKAQFDVAKPYLLKAVEINPKSVDALQDLKMYYLGKQDTQNANDTQKKIDALK